MRSPRLLTCLLAVAVAAPAAALPVRPSGPQLPVGLRKLPPSTAVLIHVRVGDLWDHPRANALRDALGDHFAELNEELLGQLGLAFADIDEMTFLTVPPRGRVREQTGIIFTSKQELDRRAILGAWRAKPEQIAAEAIPDVVKVEAYQPLVIRFLSPKSFSVMGEVLDAEYQEQAPIKLDGREPDVIRAGADEKNVAVVWFNVPVFRGALEPELNGVEQLRPIMPLLESRSGMITVTADGVLAAEAQIRAPGDRGEEVERAAHALLAFIDAEFVQLEARPQRRGARGDPIEALMIDRVRALIKTAKLERQGGIITAKGRIEIDDALVARLKGDVEKAKLSRLPARRANNLKQIALAMHNYEATRKQFPPAVITDKNGKPLFSWRVALLPYIEQGNVYQQLKMDEPWDSEHNREILKRMPAVFATPGVSKPGDTKTHVRVFAGDTAAFGMTAGRKITSFRDGTSNTILAVEAEEAVEWAKPEPLEYDANKPVPGLLFDKFGRCGVALCDGSVHAIRKEIKPEILRALITRNGGEVVDLP